MKLLAIAVMWIALIGLSFGVSGIPEKMTYSDSLLSYIALGVVVIVVELTW